MTLAAGLAVGLTAAPASAADNDQSSVYITSDPRFGGRFFCGGPYDAGTYNCEDDVTFGQTNQIFVIGTDHAVWTIWNGGGGWSRWVSLGGKGYSYVWFTNYHSNGDFTINVVGADGNDWAKRRYSSGAWSGWFRA